MLGKGSWIWITGTRAPPPHYRVAMEHRLRKPEPPDTSAEINMTSQLNNLCQEVALKTLKTQRFGNLRAKVRGGHMTPEAH